MTIWWKLVHRPELQKFFNFCAAHLPVRLDIGTKFPYFLFLPWLSKIRNLENSILLNIPKHFTKDTEQYNFVFTGLNAAQQTRGVEQVLVWCWASVADSGPALGQRRVCWECWQVFRTKTEEQFPLNTSVADSGPALGQRRVCWEC